MFRFLVLLILFKQIVFSSFIQIDEKTKYKEILSSSKVYIDYTRKLDILDFNKQNIKFINNNQKLLKFGESPNFDVWIKFELKNNSKSTIRKIIEYKDPITTNIEFYNYIDNKYIKQKDGLFSVNKNRQSLNPNFEITLEPNQIKTFYIKVFSDKTPLTIKLNLWDNKLFYKQEMKKQIILTLFFGAMIIMLVYNLFIYFSIKELSYLYYVLYIMGIIVYQSIYVGMASLYILDQSIITFLIKSLIIIVYIPVLALSFLIKSFLQTKQYPIWDKILNIYLIFYLLLIFVLIFTDSFYNIKNIALFVLLIYLMALTFYGVYKKNRQAYIVSFAWIVFLINGVFILLSTFGIYNIYDRFAYYMEFTLIVETMILSIALTDKIKQLQKNKNEANMELILQKELETIKLTKVVDKKTNSLKIALDEKSLLLKELNHRVKNNMQTIVSLIRLQIKKVEDEKVKDMFITIQNRINAMSYLYELLYYQANIAYINGYDYFTLLINELKNSYGGEVNINLDIKTDIKVEQSIYCGLILNELVTNSFKYAFKNKKGNIYIKLQKIDDNYILDVEDDGVGYDKNKDTDSLGLVLVDTLAKDQLDGDVKIQIDNGVKVQIVWK